MHFKDIYIRPLNNSFTIPDSLAVRLGPSYTTGLQTQGIRAPIFRTLQSGGYFILPAALGNGNAGTIRVSLIQLSGSMRYSVRVSRTGHNAGPVYLSGMEPGTYVLRVTGPGRTWQEPIRLGP